MSQFSLSAWHCADYWPCPVQLDALGNQAPWSSPSSVTRKGWKAEGVPAREEPETFCFEGRRPAHRATRSGLEFSPRRRLLSGPAKLCSRHARPQDTATWRGGLPSPPCMWVGCSDLLKNSVWGSEGHDSRGRVAGASLLPPRCPGPCLLGKARAASWETPARCRGPADSQVSEPPWKGPLQPQPSPRVAAARPSASRGLTAQLSCSPTSYPRNREITPSPAVSQLHRG